MATFQLNVPSAPGLSSSYSIGTPACSGVNQICTIQATDDGSGHPDITDSLKNEMLQALNTRTSTTNVRLKT